LPFLCCTHAALLAQGIAEKLNQASYMISELYTTARRFMVVFAAHFQTLLREGDLFKQPDTPQQGLPFRCRNDTLIPLADVV
jgi:glutamate racemase